MNKIGMLISFILAGCMNSADSLSKKVLEQFVNDRLTLNNTMNTENIKLLKSELISTYLDRKYYTCYGVIKVRCNKDTPVKTFDGVIKPSKDFYQMVYIKLDYKLGATGNTETGLWDHVTINTLTGREESLDKIIQMFALSDLQ